MAPKMTLKQAEEGLLSFLDQLDSSERIEAVEDLLHRLNFEKRLMLLTDEEKGRMLDESLSEQEAEALAKEKPGSQSYEDRLTMYGRARYFRRMAWTAYLNGETLVKPWSSPPKNEE